MTATTTPDTPATAAPWAPQGTLTIDTVTEHWAALHACIGQGQPVRADLAGITRVDTAGIQLLLVARRTAAGVGQDFSVSGLAVPAETCELLGITNDAANAAHPATVVGQEG
jgi:ABC-type transporter Mla MlaB component